VPGHARFIRRDPKYSHQKNTLSVNDHSENKSINAIGDARPNDSVNQPNQSRNDHFGLSVSAIAACVKTWSPGRRLTRPAPLRMAPRFLAEMPLPILRTLPASLIESASLNRRGGAKSRAVKVPDFRNVCLSHVRT
jgi:hypothetical protein